MKKVAFTTLLLNLLLGPLLFAQVGNKTATSGRYGIFGMLDSRSRYGGYWFPEPFRADETDVDNELRIDWLHQAGAGHVQDNTKFEIEKSFDLLTVEIELPYQRETFSTFTAHPKSASHSRSEGFGNISIGVRHPVYQYVSADDIFDHTLGVAFEVGIPSNSPVGKNAEIVPKFFYDLRVGDHFSLQTILGYSIIFGSQPDGGKHTFEYAAVFGYALEREQLKISGIDRIIPTLEFKGETGLNKGEAGHDNLSGTIGVRFNLKSVGGLQPRLGIGYVFPIDKGARDDFGWGIMTSLVFEF